MSGFEQMWRDLAPIGRSATTGGYFRQPFTAAETECRAWFVDQAQTRGLVVEGDDVGNLFAWWPSPPRPDQRAVLTGSHLDSVHDGGAYDGPLGVVSALAALDLLRDRGFTPSRPIGVCVFVEEEGSRFGVPCLGSRLWAGTMSWAAARELRDRDGVFLLDAMEAAGVSAGQSAEEQARLSAGPEAGPAATERGRSGLADRVECFVELHVEQGRDLVHRDAAVGVASAIRPHGRYRFAFTGAADHAGTTRMEDRRDPMLTYAMTALAANKQARLSGQRATFGRVDVRPNATNAVPSEVTAWLDARADSGEHLDALLAQVERLARERADRDGTALEVTAESVSAEVAFDADLARRTATREGGTDLPVIPTMAGHDAGVLQAAGVPSAMLFVRNPTGVSHSPAETAETADCLRGVEVLADTLERMAR